MVEMKEKNLLYLVITEEYGRGRSAAEIAGKAAAGGVDMLQMREKKKPRGELVKLGRRLRTICAKAHVKFIVNDDPILAKKVKADGVHLGQEDLSAYPLKKARKILGPDSIIGVSTHSLKQFTKANREGFDYIAFGPIFPTKTKSYFIGTRDVEKVLKAASKPVFFIGGINMANIDKLLSCGAKNIALIRAILEADNIKKSAAGFKKKLKG